MTELPIGELRARAVRAVHRRWPDARLEDIRPLHGGISSLTFAATLTGAESAPPAVVIKMAPPGLAPVRNRDVLRQARAIDAIHGSPGVSVPEVLVTDDGSPPFFIMEFVPGESYEPKWDHSGAPPAAEIVDARARAAARMLGRLQTIDPAAVGLGDEPVLSPAQELERWGRLFATAGDDLRGDELKLQWALAARVPNPEPGIGPAVLHGDYRLGNMQFDGDRLAAIIDWELWSLGDRRCDLAWVMAFADPVMQRVAQRDTANQAAADAMPAAEDLLAEYAADTAITAIPADLSWFMALCYYKLGATMSVLAKRNRRAADPDPGLELAAATTPAMLERAMGLLS